MRRRVKVYKIFMCLNHKFKFLVKLDSLTGIKCTLSPWKRLLGVDGSSQSIQSSWYNWRYKARLYPQEYIQHNFETYSPVTKVDSVKVLFSLTANKNWSLYQFDVKNGFLHGELQEEVYMGVPPGFWSLYKRGCNQRKFYMD